MIDAGTLQLLLTPLAPIDSVEIVNPQDKATWVVHYNASATTQQIAAAQAYLTAYDVTKPPPTEQAKNTAIANIKANLNSKNVTAFALADWKWLLVLLMAERGWLKLDGTVIIP